MSTVDGISRQELVGGLARLEATVRPPSPAVQAHDSAVVSQNEFRLFKWLAAFVVAALLAGFGLLYQQMTDLRLGVEHVRAEVIRELGVLGERPGRVETRLDLMEARLGRVETRLDDMAGRLSRMDTRLDGAGTELTDSGSRATGSARRSDTPVVQ